MSYLNPGRTSDIEPAQDLLIAGSFPVETKEVDIPAGAEIVKGSVMGRITSGGNYVLSLTAAGDGSQNPSAILLQTVEVSGGARKGLIGRTGNYAAFKLVYGTGHSRATVEEPLRALSIFLTDVLEN
ncbi:MAG: head decoration protein [Gemmatimonadaceae bacterium]|nr:head decoration protein [Gemmatimonadaceae bacterium]